MRLFLALTVGFAVAGVGTAAAPLPWDPLAGSAAACVGDACDDRLSQTSQGAFDGSCGASFEGPGFVTVFARNRPGEPRMEIKWRVPPNLAASRVAMGIPSLEDPGSHLYLMFAATPPRGVILPAAPPLTRITLGASFGADAPHALAGPAPRIALVAAGRTFGPWPAGAETYRAAVALKPKRGRAVPESAATKAQLADLLAAVRSGPTAIVLFDTAGRKIAEAPLTPPPQAADVERTVIWARFAERVLRRGRCPP